MEKKISDRYNVIDVKRASDKLISNINLLLQKDGNSDDGSIVEIEVCGVKQKHCLFIMQDTLNKINKYLIEFIETYGSSIKGKEQFCQTINYIIEIISQKEKQIKHNGEQVHGDFYNAYFLNINGGDSLRTIVNFSNIQMKNVVFHNYNGQINFDLAHRIINSVKNNNKERELLKNNLYSAYTDYLISNNKLDIRYFLNEFSTVEEKLSIIFQFAKTFYTGKLDEKYINKKYEEIFLKSFLNTAKNNNFKEYFKNMLKNTIISSLNVARLSVPLTNITTYLIENGEKEIIKDIFDSIKEIANDKQIYAEYPSVESSLKQLHKEVSIQVFKKLDEEKELEEIENLAKQIDMELTEHITVENSETTKYSEYKKTLINECGLYDISRGIIDSMIDNVSNGIKYLTEMKDKTISFGKKIFGTVCNGVNYLWGSSSKKTEYDKESKILKKEANNLSNCFSELSNSTIFSKKPRILKFN